MTANQTLPIFIILLIYLVGLGFLLNAVAVDVPSMNYTPTSDTFMGGTFAGNIVSSVGDMPLWANTILIIIPAILLVWLGVLLLLHG